MSDIFMSEIAAREKRAEERRARLSKVYFISGAKMMQKQFPEPRYLWQGILPDSGLAVCAASKASGKTLLLLQLADAISRGRDFLGIPTTAANVLFVELELSEAKTTQRLLKMGITVSDTLTFSYNTKDKQWPPGEEGLKTLKDAIEEHSYELVVVDVLQRLWPMNADYNSYQDSYAVLSPLRQLANEMGVMILLVTHNRKMQAADFLDGVMGSVGIVANADVILSIQRQRGENEAVLFVEGNDIESRQLALRFESDPLGFALSDAAPGEIGQTQERRAILDALRQLGGTAKPGQIAALLNKERSGVSHALQKMAKLGIVIMDGYGKYAIHTVHTIHTSQNKPDIKADCDVYDESTPIHTIHTIHTSEDKATVNSVNTVNATIEESEPDSEATPTEPPKIRLGKPRADWPASFRSNERGDMEFGLSDNKT
ncbi:MAG: AAA family ATPase [Rectinema subterraneum]